MKTNHKPKCPDHRITLHCVRDCEIAHAQWRGCELFGTASYFIVHRPTTAARHDFMHAFPLSHQIRQRRRPAPYGAVPAGSGVNEPWDCCSTCPEWCWLRGRLAREHRRHRRLLLGVDNTRLHIHISWWRSSDSTSVNSPAHSHTPTTVLGRVAAHVAYISVEFRVHSVGL